MTIRERVINNLLLLHLIEKCNEKGYVEDPLKLQKLVFLTQRKSVRRRAKGFSYNFFRWKMGPFSANLNEDLDLLIDGSFLSGKYNIRLTSMAQDFLGSCRDILDRNHYFSTNIKRTAGNYAKYSSDELKERVYRISVFIPRIRKSMLIKSVPMGNLILYRTSDRKASSKFSIDDDWLATLEMIFDKEAIESLKRSQRDAIEGKICEPVRNLQIRES